MTSTKQRTPSRSDAGAPSAFCIAGSAIAAFIVSVIGTAFVIGDRLQRDTEGLV